MARGDFPGHPKYRRLRQPTSQLVSLKQYCADNFCTRSTALYRIGAGQLIGYKFKGRWWVVDPALSTTVGA